MMAFMTEVSSTAGANQTIPQNLLTYGKISSKKNSELSWRKEYLAVLA